MHIVGAGLAGLAAAVRLVGTGREVVVHELAPTPAAAAAPISSLRSGLTIDNGNHLLLSANDAALGFLQNHRQ